MQRKTGLLMILAVFLIFSTAACGKQTPDPEAYETYTSEINGFSVVLPKGYTAEEDSLTGDGKMGMARFTVEGGDVGVVLDARTGGEETLPETKKAYQEQNPEEEVLQFTNLSKAGEFDGYKVMMKIKDSKKIGLLYVYRFGDTEVTVAAKTEDKKQAKFLEVGLDQIRLPQSKGVL